MGPSINFLGIVFALASAAVWGGADFSGGLAARRSSQFQVVALASLSGIVVLIAAAAGWGEPVPSPPNALWATLAGAVGALGVAAFYHALATGRAATVAPTAAVVGAAIPVWFGMQTQGLPHLRQLAGFAFALLGIWLVSQSPGAIGSEDRRPFLLACLAGIGFGGFFTLIAQVKAGAIFAPLAVARGVGLCTALLILRVRRTHLPSPLSNPVALLAGVLDVCGNVLYLLAAALTRLDVVIVLASMYPATTVFLARGVQQERVSRTQWIGVGLCLVAIALIAA